MHVTEAKARSMLVAAGFATAEDWPLKKLTNVLNHLDEREDELQEIEDKDDRHTLKLVLKARAEDDEIEVADSKHEENGASKKPTAKKKGKPKKENGEIKKDAFGYRVGSQASAINDQLGKRPKDVKAIAEATKLEAGRIRSHLYSLMLKRKIVHTDKGYAVKA